MSSLTYGHGQVFENFAQAGLTPYPAQQSIKHIGEIGGVVVGNSPFGANPTPELAFGFEAVFQLDSVDDEYETFHKTGFYDNAVIRRTQLGMPIPSDYSGPDAPVQYADDHLKFVGVFGPAVGEKIHDTETKSVYHIFGTTDILIHEDVKPYEPMVWRPATMKEIEQDAKNGSRLQRRNPGAPRIVPFNSRFISGPISSVSKMFLSKATQAEWNELKNGKVNIDSLADKLLKRVTITKMVNGKQITQTHYGSKKQVKFWLGIVHDAIQFSGELDNYLSLPATGANTTKAGGKLTDRLSNMIATVSDYHSYRASHLVGTALSRGQAGGTTHLLIGSGAV